jgi:hypothetical protein
VKFLRFWLISVLAIGSNVACNPPSDIGTVCALPNPDGGPGLWTQTSETDDLFYSGTAECENLICLRPHGSGLDAGYGYCSNSCTPTNPQDDNSSSPDCAGATVEVDGDYVGMVCRAVALDQAFINQILSEDGGQALLEQYLGGTTPPVLCTTPE